MKKTFILFCFTFLLSISSCKEKKTEPKWDPSGLYNVKVSINKRPLFILENDTSTIEYAHEKIMGQVFDTSVSQCCHWTFGIECPDTYELFNIRIFKYKENYYLYNSIDSMGDLQTTSHIPLTMKDKKLTVDNRNTKHVFSLIRRLGKPGSIMWSTVPGYSNRPFWMLDFTLNFSTETATGEWVLIEENENPCTKLMSNKQSREFITSEFSSITFERIGD